MSSTEVQRIAVPLAGGRFSSHFGQSTAFAIFDVDWPRRQITGRRDFPLLGNNACGFAPWLREKGAGVLIVNGIGMGALAGLQSANITVRRGDPTLGVEALVQACLDGGLEPAQVNCNHDHGHGNAGACHCHAH